MGCGKNPAVEASGARSHRELKVIGKLGSCLKYGIPILGLSIICPNFWLLLGVTLAGFIIGVSLVYAALERYFLKTRSRRLKGLALTAAIMLYFGVVLVLTHYSIISELDNQGIG